MVELNAPESNAEPAGPGTGQALLRDANLAAVTRALFASAGSASRVDLAETTGLTRATVSRLVDQLVEAGIAEKLPPVRLPQQGRPASPILPAAGKLGGIGLEINVDYIAGRAMDLAGNTLSDFEIAGDYANSDPEEVIDRLANMAGAMIQGLESAQVTLVGVCLAIPGVLSLPEGKLLIAPNLGWNDVPLADLLQERLQDAGDVPVTVNNDGNLQGILAAHVRPGLLREDSTFFYIVGDRGIGGAIIEKGEPNLGETGWAGEIGHMCVDVNGVDCFCGSRGCLERYAGVSAILSNAGLDPKVATLEGLESLLESRDERALEAIDIARGALAVALANTVNLLDISRIIIGTSLGRLLPWMEPGLSELTNSLIIGRDTRTVEISAATSSVRPACSGGALVAMQPVLDDPAAWIWNQKTNTHGA